MDTKTYIESKLLETKRDGMEDLVKYMNQIGFFEAPCSGSYHLAEEGGLAEHTKHVMEFANKIATSLFTKKYLTKEFTNSLQISAALHDLGKCGQFDKPNYVPNLLKNGNQSESKPYKTNPDLLYVDHEIRSIVMAQMFIDLTEDEQFAILYHNGMYSNLKYALSGKETPLQMIVHWADMWACRVIENEN